MKKIRSQKDLHSEKLRLKLQLFAAEKILKDDLEWVKEEMTSRSEERRVGKECVP